MKYLLDKKLIWIRKPITDKPAYTEYLNTAGDKVKSADYALGMKNKNQIKITESEVSMDKVDPVKYIEEEYPETAKSFKEIQKEQYELFCKKQMDYGPKNISVGTDLKSDADVKLSLTGLWFRMNDKIQRLKNLLMSGQKANNEPLEDSYLDVSNYGIMATIVNNNKWGKQDDKSRNNK